MTINKITLINKYSTVFEKAPFFFQISKEIYKTAHKPNHRESVPTDHMVKWKFGLGR